MPRKYDARRGARALEGGYFRGTSVVERAVDSVYGIVLTEQRTERTVLSTHNRTTDRNGLSVVPAAFRFPLDPTWTSSREMSSSSQE